MTKKINKDLTAEQKLILFEDGTEAPGTSELNHEKREGSYHCANCGEKLFDSNAKYESGSGWPSFYQSLPDAFETKTDTLLGYERVEYHCKKCGGHIPTTAPISRYSMFMGVMAIDRPMKRSEKMSILGSLGGRVAALPIRTAE